MRNPIGNPISCIGSQYIEFDLSGSRIYCTDKEFVLRKKGLAHINAFKAWLKDENLPKDILEKSNKIRDYVYEKPDLIIQVDDIKEIEITKGSRFLEIWGYPQWIIKFRLITNELKIRVIGEEMDDFLLKTLKVFAANKLTIKK